MKALLKFLFFLLILWCHSAKSQQLDSVPRERRHVLKINLLSLPLQTVSLLYELKLTPRMTGQTGLFYTFYKATIHDTSFSYKGLAFTPEYRYYFGPEAMKGLYAGAFMRLASLNHNVDFKDSSGHAESGKSTMNTYGGGFLVGYEKSGDGHFVFDIFVGPQYNFYDLKITTGRESYFRPGPLAGFGMRAGIALGYRF